MTSSTQTDRPAARPVEADAAEQVIYAVSHDLQGPLLNIRGFLGRLREGCTRLRTMTEAWPLDPAQREACNHTLDDRVLRSVDILDQCAGRMQQRIQALLELSRAGREPVSLENLDSQALVLAVAEEFQAEAARRGAKLEAGAVPELRTDAPRLAAVLRQLVSNALRFLSPDRPGVVHIEGRTEAGEARLWVRDNGIGLRAQDCEQIFHPFGRVRELAPGEGTGLATVRKLMRQQGGRVWVESAHGQGSTFFLALPRGD